MDAARKIEVPFEKKAKARALGAVFNKDDRCWYIPDNADESTETALRNLATEEESLSETVCNTDISCNSTENVTNNILQSEETSGHYSEIATEDWNNLITSRDTLKIALTIRDYGMPNNETQREELLKILSIRRPGDYPVSYDGMLECSENFASLYSIERTTTLIKDCIKGERSYMDEIRNSNLTGEEKALLMFVLPIE